MTQVIPRPEFVTDEHLRFLDELRKGGSINMFESPMVLKEVYSELSMLQCKVIFKYWAYTFKDRR